MAFPLSAVHGAVIGNRLLPQFLSTALGLVGSGLGSGAAGFVSATTRVLQQRKSQGRRHSTWVPWLGIERVGVVTFAEIPDTALTVRVKCDFWAPR